jgi:hypothetical protein
MTFTSPAFAPFLLCVLGLALALGRKRRWIVLLGASLVSYATFGAPYLLPVLVVVAVSAFGCALAMERTTDPGRRKVASWSFSGRSGCSSTSASSTRASMRSVR